MGPAAGATIDETPDNAADKTTRKLADKPAKSGATPPATGLIWDLPLRLFHWLLVASLGAGWLTAELGVEYREWHFWCGYTTLALLLFRLLWGFVGPRHARFTQFVRGPAAVLADLRAEFRRENRPHNGHSALGALAVLALLTLVAIQAVTGLFTDDDILYVGPWAPAVSGATVEWLSDLHHANFDRLLAMVVLHVAAIGFYQFVRRRNLVGPMLHGRQVLVPDAAGAEPAISGSAVFRGLVVLAVAGLVVWALVTLAPEPVYDEFEYY